MIRRLLARVSLALLLVPGPAAAHLVSTRFGELYSGVLHPLTALQHLVPWLAIGLIAGLQRTDTARWALGVFPAAILLGIVVAQAGVALPYPNALTVGSFLLLGMLLALGMKLSTPVFLFLLTLFGLGQGYANSAVDLNGMPAVLYATGVMLSAYVLVALAAAGTHALVAGPRWGIVAVRAAGSWVAAAGLVYGGLLVGAS